MSFFDYGNTRLKVRISELLSKADLFKIAEALSLERMLSLLIHTTYRESIKEALTTRGGLECIIAALQIEGRKIRDQYHNFYEEKIGKLVHLLFFHYDLSLVKAIIRNILVVGQGNKVNHSYPAIISFSDTVLSQLEKVRGIDDLANLLVFTHLPFSQILNDWKKKGQRVELFQLEIALEKHLFNFLINLHEHDADAILLCESEKIIADRNNLFNIYSSFYKNIPASVGDKDKEQYSFIGPGFLSKHALIEMATNPDAETIISVLQNSRYRSIFSGMDLKNGDQDFPARLEEGFRKYYLRWASYLPNKDPLGLGVPLGYLVMKEHEMRNLRWIAHSLSFGINQADTKENLEII